MGKQDFFYEIAKTKHPSDTTDHEIPARELPNRFLRQTESAVLMPMKTETYEEQKEKFQKELKEMRKYYRPFMENYLSPLPVEIPTIYFQKFFFRYCEKNECFTERNDSKYEWKEVKIPDYRGPARENGKWEAYYKTGFSCPDTFKEKCSEGQRIVLTFQCVDYIAEIYVNGCFVGRHEGFFAPFSFDITKYIRQENELIILCKNDIPILGEGEFLDGDKIYAATGPGWDDPEVGWHHCPAGAGVFGKVSLQLRPELYVDDIFIRPDFRSNSVEARIGVVNYTDEVKKDLNFTIALEPKNYEGEPVGRCEKHVTAAGPGKNEYRYFFPIENYRIWESKTPWLYGAKAILSHGGKVVSAAIQTVGFKEFISDETSEPKGKFYMNGKPAVLRGANEMGHLQQCVMDGNFDQLVDDILIAKMCHMNYYRITQRPVQEEIYDYFDMLGMMHQCDFPLFGFLRRPQFSEALRQVTEMEHLVRKHVSTVMTTLINEPMCIRRTEDPNDKFSRRYEAKGHRHLLRDELEAFFQAARKAIYTENPDRVVKNVEGDYDGPTAEGMPDFHTYTMWYTNHGEPIGRLMRGYLPPVKEGWMIGCGEYGAEGLDSADLMRRRYPASWTACDENGCWYPDRIVRAQTYAVHGDWYREQHTMEDWVRESQKHQAYATKLMTDAFRRRADVINQTAVHLLIDAWPSGWMKTLVDCERNPKPAYFAYKEALIPLKLNLYTARNSAYEDETVSVELWVLNDTSDRRNLNIRAEIREEGSDVPYAMYCESYQIPAADACCAGIVPVHFAKKSRRRTVIVQAALFEKEKLIHQEEIRIEVYARRILSRPVFAIGQEAEHILSLYGGTSQESDVWLLSGENVEDICRMEEHLNKGGRVIWLLPEYPVKLMCCGKQIETKSCGDLFFAASSEACEKYEFNMEYNSKKGYIDATASYTICTELQGDMPFYTYDKRGCSDHTGAKQHQPFVIQCTAEGGMLTLISLARDGRIGYNGGLDEFLIDLMEI